MTDLLNEFSIDNLKHRTETSFDTKKRHKVVDEVSVRNLTYNQLSDDKIRADAATSSGGVSYTSQIVFNDVKIVPQGTEGSLDILHTNNIMPIPTETECQFRCTCLDFRWTFAHYNDVSANLHGQPPQPYQAVTQRGPRNPTKTPGLCKHLLKMIEVLKNGKIIQ